MLKLNIFESADTYKTRHRRIHQQLYFFEHRHATDTDIGKISLHGHDTDNAIKKSADTLQTHTTLIHKIADMS